jgi:hypothetical protein
LRVGIFAASANAMTVDFQAGDVGYWKSNL